VQDNPQPGADWTEADFEYADAEMQRVRTRVEFTYVDFLACDPRNAGHFALMPHESWNGHLVPVAQWLAGPGSAHSGDVPCLLVVDGGDVLRQLVVDDRAIQAARRCRETWRRLQELGGVRSSHAARAVARAKAAREEQAPEVVATAGPAAGPDAAGIVGPEPSHAPDAAFVETVRCSSCNECIQVNDRMFAYNANKQAYLADLSAGTFRQLVEAAENCQLGLIHPGKPRDAAEPGLEDLLERARAFA
jgi:hypothetical protein